MAVTPPDAGCQQPLLIFRLMSVHLGADGIERNGVDVGPVLVMLRRFASRRACSAWSLMPRILNADAAWCLRDSSRARIQHLEWVSKRLFIGTSSSQFVAEREEIPPDAPECLSSFLIPGTTISTVDTGDITCGDAAETFRWHGTDLPDRVRTCNSLVRPCP